MYQVLYRKYRPKVFSDVYGQDHVTSTLRNEIQNNRISHAYLFTGSRGTGKTTCAKILAKAVNCPHNHNGEPCNECEICKAIENGSINDVIEIDAASNRKVEDARELRDSTNYTPSAAKYRVFIIDEVHMLTTEAFNALLKTLEEPPEHVIFILATTDVQKVLPTIRSRCQRFDFKRIQPETMAIRLHEVAKLEGLTLTEEAAILIARIADGALRDGLSILDQCASRSKNIDATLVSEASGLAGREALYQFSDFIVSRNTNAAMELISSLYENSYDMERLCVDLIGHFRDFLLVKTVTKSRGLLVCTDDEYERITATADRFTLESVIYALDLLQETLIKIKGGATPRLELEMALIRLCEPRLENTTEALLDRLSRVEQALKNGIIPAESKPTAPAVSPVKAVPMKPEVKEVPDTVTEPEDMPPFDLADEKPELPEEKTAASETSVSAPDDFPADDLPPFDMDIPTEAEAPPAPEQAPKEPVKTPAVSPPAAETAPDGREPFMQWGEFIDEIKKLDISLFSVLNGAKAYLEGDKFLVDSPNRSLSDFIRIENRSRKIKQALFNVTGRQYRLFILKHDNNDKPKRDPLEDLIRNAQGKLGNIDVK